MKKSRLAPALLVALASAACGHGSAPSACPADGYPAPTLRSAGCTPGSSWLAYAFTKQGTSSPALFIGKADGSCAERVTSDSAFLGGPAFFPGGKKLVYASTRSGTNQLYVRDLLSGEETKLDTAYAFRSSPAAPVPLAAATPAVSPDGATIAFEGSLPAAYPGWSDVFTVPAAGGNVVRATDDPAAATLPRWSGDGTTLYFLSYRTGAAELFSAPPDGSLAATQVTTGSDLSSKFALSGDGQALVYARFSTTGTGLRPTELVARDFASGAIRVIASANEADPAVDAGNASVAVSRRTAAGGYDLYLLDYGSGAVKQQLTACAGQAFGATFAR